VRIVVLKLSVRYLSFVSGQKKDNEPKKEKHERFKCVNEIILITSLKFNRRENDNTYCYVLSCNFMKVT